MNKPSKAIKVNKATQKKIDKYKFLTLKMYTYKIFNYLLRGNIDDRDPNLDADKMQIGYSEIFTLKNVTKYFVISHLPEDTPVAFMNHLLKDLKSGDYWISLSLQTKSRQYHADLDSNHVQAKLGGWHRRVQEHDSNDVFLKSTSNKMKMKRLLRSYFKIRDNKTYTRESALIIKLQTRTKAHMRLATAKLKSKLNDLEVKHYEVRGTVLDFLRAFSLVSRRKTVSMDTTNRVLMTNRDLVDMIPYRQGKIGGNKPSEVWFGIDMDSGSSIWLDIANNPNAKNMLIAGESGSGKTFFMRVLAMFFNALKYNLFFHDHKGNEFTAFTRAVGGLIISMTPTRPSYINTFKVPINEASTEEELKALFLECFSVSELIFLTLTEPNKNDTKKYKDLFSDFMRHVHAKIGTVPNDVSTFHHTNKLTPPILYDLYVEFRNSASIQKVYDEAMLNSIQLSLQRYWHPKGTKHVYFQNEIQVSELTTNRVICFDFGMAETTRNTVSDNEMKLKKIFKNFSSSRFVNNNKKNQEVTVKVTEEIQSADEDILQFTSADVTEGRAKNMINIILGNATGTLASDNPYAKNIMENINIQLLGYLPESSREFFTKRFDLQKMRGALDRIALDPAYKNCFLLNCRMLDEPVTAVTKAVTTKRVANSDFLKTVDIA